MSYLKYLLVFLVMTSAGCMALETTSNQEIINYIENHLPHYGELKNDNGFVYVDVDDDYVHKLVTFIQDEGFQEPPYFGRSDTVGAHITVVYPREMFEYGLEEIQECGEIIHFVPIECKVVHPPRWQTIDEVYFVVVEAPELDRIRERYGLPKREYCFHITIGVKPKVAQAA